ncbi:4'-phosphopantetheinyl transferase [Coprinopsis marcescibilis]|uniref:4'-phosphopantetheinyl transferase n=1 Tax=Coprinopsis marcescibilis TaxID=230819 RepID=A0A5C3L7S5_COPMA|nr:4'-phosphopantetheinyl transferase [Coprinopsis marcescibilis]
MAILGIGVDIVHLPRIVSILKKSYADKFVKKILSPQEYVKWASLKTSEEAARVRFVAVRFCVKEAAYKAIYPSARPTWKEFTYSGLTGGEKPSLRYAPLKQLDKPSVGAIHVSVSHDGDYVFSQVLVEAPTACQ